MNSNEVTYPIGQQDFRELRKEGSVYVDKTMYIDRLLKTKSQYVFLARPRRFGKSLFLSTLRYFFEGKREFFRGLYIDSTDWKWEKHPVLRLDLNPSRFDEPQYFDALIENYLYHWEKEYGVERLSDDHSTRFANIIRTAHEKTGLQAVILIDEYDKPLVSNLDDPDRFEYFRKKLANLYGNFKTSAEHIKLVFLTGVSRFSRLSVFSDLNNIKDITFSDEYADICGITERELVDNFQYGIQALADKKGFSFDKALSILKRNYDGYRFAPEGSDIYNPWSVLNCMKEMAIGNYWNETGMPTLIAESLKRIDADLEKIFDSYCSASALKGMDLQEPNPIALLYQTGYLTIKDYDTETEEFRLGIPNNEVKAGLYDVLLPYYVKVRGTGTNALVSTIIREFTRGNADEAMEAIKKYFKGVDYKLKMEDENNFHNAFFLLTDMIGLKTQAEVHTSDGSIDIVIKTRRFIYVIELKYDHTPEEALEQINRKGYALPYENDPHRLIKIGFEFSSKTRTVERWLIN